MFMVVVRSRILILDFTTLLCVIRLVQTYDSSMIAHPRKKSPGHVK